jgi:Protein of unknown function (DUF4019)
MHGRLAVLVLTLVSASACSKACAPGRTSSGTYSYLVVPSGRTFRLLRTSPAVNEEHQKVGAVVSYAGESPELSRIQTEAEALAVALTPEREAAGEGTLIIGVRFGVDARRDTSPAATYHTVFNRAGGHWVRAPAEASEAKVLEGLAEAPPREEVEFAFEPKTVEAAAKAAANWLALLDAGAADAALSEMTDSFRAQLSVAPAQWHHVLQRRAGLGESRRELYRQQSWPTTLATPRSGVTAVQYLSRTANGARVLERVTLVCESTGCKVTGYTLKPLRGG